MNLMMSLLNNLLTGFDKYLFLFLLNIFINNNSLVYGAIEISGSIAPEIEAIDGEAGEAGETGEAEAGTVKSGVAVVVFIVVATLILILLTCKKCINNIYMYICRKFSAPVATIAPVTENISDEGVA
ncbi:hypothetical protein C1645_822855 [Glomus cerebriforme]|uniref:Uncharacterized protein n=1 Tax=Glomus cerebriforme TaxID=658196 RepID=A0A397T3K4_9GLOM|nr:hypothetical protein C1645_822855 [Glomus cerebriforme]